jgi:tetratricopeptide (TPR) repeat protein
MKAIILIILVMLSIARSSVYIDEVTLWSDVVAKSPNRARQHINLGHALQIAGPPDDALAHFKKALYLEPDNLDAQFNLTVQYYDMGLMAEAERECDLIIQRYPSSREAAFSRKMLPMIRAQRKEK